MDPASFNRFQLLAKGPWIPPTLVAELYGVDINDTRLQVSLRTWLDRIGRGPQSFESRNQFDRFILESFFQSLGLLPLKWAGLRWALDTPQFNQILNALETRGFFPRSGMSDQLIVESQFREVVHFLPGLKNRIFGDHNDFCRRLHADLSAEFQLNVQPLHCVTSVALNEDPPDYAHELDIITLEPVGLRYQVWLDFGKPVSLRPDACSLKLYARERALLEGRMMRGQDLEIPAGLS